MSEVKPVYQVEAWRDDDWWVARVVGASDGADTAPVNAMAQAPTLARVDPVARDLIATILDAAKGTFDITVDYDLSDAGHPTESDEPRVLPRLNEGLNF